jgi:hypothetical protein
MRLIIDWHWHPCVIVQFIMRDDLASFVLTHDLLQVTVVSAGLEEKQLWSMGKKVVDKGED